MPERVTGARPAAAARRLLPLLLLPAGCYRYVPVAAAAAPAPGAEVRLHLTPAGSAHVAPALGAQTVFVAGRAERAGGDSLRLQVAESAGPTGAATRWVGERVTLPIAAVARGEQRVLDRRRSFLAGAGAVLGAAAGYALLRAVAGGGAGAGGDQPVPTP
jgi:hypothetical protein